MSKICFFLVVYFALFYSVVAQKKHCEEVLKGHFYCESPSGGYVYIHRKKRKQIEKYENESQRFKFKIEWMDACSYTLILSRTKNVARAVKKEILGSSIVYYIEDVKHGYHTVFFLNEEGVKVNAILYDN